MGIFQAENDYPDGSPRWVARYKLSPKKWKRLEFASKPEADREVLNNGGPVNQWMRPTMAIDTVIEWFLAGHLERGVDEETTIEEYRSRLHRWLSKELGGDTAFGSLTASHYVAVLEAMQAVKRADVTVMKTFAVIRQLVTVARIHGFTTCDPVSAMLPDLKVRRQPLHTGRVPDEHCKAIRAASNPKLRFMYALARESHVEPSEQRRLRRGDIDLAGNTMFVRDLPLADDPPDHPRGRRVAMTPTLWADACRWLALTAGEGTDLVFPEEDAHDHTMAFNAVQREAGLFRVGAHEKYYALYPIRCFLLMAAEDAAEQGRDLKTMSEDFGFVTVGPVQRKVGWLIEAIAEEASDRRHLRRHAAA